MRDRLRWVKAPRYWFATKAVLRASGGKVIAGPFAGMQLRPGESFLPYVLGTYELETHAVLERLIAEPFDFIVDVGAAEGYIAIGLARRCPKAEILAYEMDEERCKHLLSTARLNGVGDRITLAGKCDPPALNSAISRAVRTLLIVDIEGGEIGLLEPQAAAGLADATIFVETHDLMVPGCAATIKERFSATHRIESISTRPRVEADFPITSLRSSALVAPSIVGMMDELRPATQEFLLMTPMAPA